MNHEITVTGTRVFDADDYNTSEAIAEIMEDIRDDYPEAGVTELHFEHTRDGYEYHVELSK